MAIKNLWSLNIDELLVSDKLKGILKKTDYEVLIPLNTQMKDIDLVLLDLKTNNAKTIQVKGSRTYTPRKAEVKRYGDGSAAWFRIHRNSIFKPSNKVDYYIFVLHNFIDGPIKKEIRIDFLIMPTPEFHIYCNNKTVRKGGYYHFLTWIDSKGGKIFDFREDKNNPYNLNKYLNNWEMLT